MRLILTSASKWGQLRFLREMEPLSGYRRFIECACTCGNTLAVQLASVQSGNTVSCGCYRQKVSGDSKRTHGLSGIPEHGIWKGIIKRCYNQNAIGYENYGGRGIKIADCWRSDFPAFFAYVGPRPSPRYSIDRYPDTNGNYCPGNVRWATDAEQSRNTRRNVWLTIDGSTMVLQDWADELGVEGKLARSRIAHGWPPEVALKSPKGTRLCPGVWSPARREAFKKRNTL